jgi:hypothetical protein
MNALPKPSRCAQLHILSFVVVSSALDRCLSAAIKAVYLTTVDCEGTCRQLATVVTACTWGWQQAFFFASIAYL